MITSNGCQTAYCIYSGWHKEKSNWYTRADQRLVEVMNEALLDSIMSEGY